MNNEKYFDRDFWVHKQLSLVIFRLGELEYEFINDSISIHTPSDAVLTKSKIDKSIKMLLKFIKKYSPNYKDKLIYCDSWLLSPNLAKYLHEESNILTFQNYFNIKKISENYGNVISIDYREGVGTAYYVGDYYAHIAVAADTDDNRNMVFEIAVENQTENEKMFSGSSSFWLIWEE